MTGGPLALIDLSRLTTDCQITRLSRFLPWLAQSRPPGELVAVTPVEHAEVVRGWGVQPVTSRAPLGMLRSRIAHHNGLARIIGRDVDLVLSPLSASPIVTSMKHIAWGSAQTSGRIDAAGVTGDAPETIGKTALRVSRTRPDLVIYPTVAARIAGESEGRLGPSLVIRPPLATSRWTRQGTESPRQPEQQVRILVPSGHYRRNNLALVTRVSRVLSAGSIGHQVVIAGPRECEPAVDSLRTLPFLSCNAVAAKSVEYDVVLLTGLDEPDCDLFLTLEKCGASVAAANLPGHAEVRHRAHLFDPASAHGAADAVVATLRAGVDMVKGDDDLGWRESTPRDYAQAVSAEIDRVRRGGRLIEWAV